MSVRFDETRVVVEEGQVKVEYEYLEDQPKIYSLLQGGEQVRIESGQHTPLRPAKVEVNFATRWAKRIVADEEAFELVRFPPDGAGEADARKKVGFGGVHTRVGGGEPIHGGADVRAAKHQLRG